jgi:hypothetical protein
MKECEKDAIAAAHDLELQTLPKLDKGNLNLQNAVFKYLEALQRVSYSAEAHFSSLAVSKNQISKPHIDEEDAIAG